MNELPNLGIDKLIDVSGLHGRTITAGHIGFTLAPRLNAAGRVTHATRAVELLVTDDVDLAEVIAQGDFTKNFVTNRKDEIGLISKSLNHISVGLREMFHVIGDTSSNVIHASEEISASGQEMTASNEEVYRNVHEVSEIAAEQLAEAKALAAKIEAGSVTVHIKGGENGKTYGSVSTKELAEAVKEQLGLELDKKKIALAEPIKNFGSYETVVKLHRDVQATLKVNVTEAK